uniref:Uncharacterized protein n=1 Tax=Sinocyclocheilus grahami TaxID=75366 RepID=A0A672LXX0_SINGR
MHAGASRLLNHYMSIEINQNRTMNDRELDLTEAQKATKSKYPPITKKYECKWIPMHSRNILFFLIIFLNSFITCVSF